MKITVLLLTILIGFPSLSYAGTFGDINTTSLVLQDTVEDTTPQLGGNLDTNGKRVLDATDNGYTGSGVDDATYNLADILQSRKSDMNFVSLKEYKLKATNFAITGGVGISGVAYIPEVGLWLFVDNNAVNVSIYQEDNFATEWGNITLTGFTDPEALEYLWTIYDANGQPDTAVLAISEEGLTEFSIVEMDLQNTAQTITRASWPIIAPTGMWTDSATLGLEAMTYDPFRNVMYCFKQDTPFEIRVVPIDGTLTPASTEPWDAETILSATLPAINDATFDYNTRTIILIGDQTSADNNNQDIVRVDPIAGTILEDWQTIVDWLGLNQNATTDWAQSEGIAITPDGQYIGISSEGENFAILERVSQKPIFAGLRTVTASDNQRSNDTTILCNAAGGAITITLLPAANCTGHLLNIKKTDSSANAVTVDANASETIDGATTQATTTQYVNFQIQSDGSNWHIL